MCDKIGNWVSIGVLHLTQCDTRLKSVQTSSEFPLMAFAMYARSSIRLRSMRIMARARRQLLDEVDVETLSVFWMLRPAEREILAVQGQVGIIMPILISMGAPALTHIQLLRFEPLYLFWVRIVTTPAD